MRMIPAVAVLLATAPACSIFLSDPIILTPEVVDVLDNWLYEGLPDKTHGTDPLLQCDGDHEDAGQAVGLLRFDLSDGSIPAGAPIASATLHLAVQDGGGPAELLEVLASWDESTTWNSFGSEPGPIPATDFATDPVATISTSGFGGQVVGIDVTDSVIAWLAGERENRGWLFLCASPDGAAFFTSDAEPPRPTLVLEEAP